MPQYGFIHTKDEIKFLVLYAMSFLTFPVNLEAIVDICTWCDGGFNYFELQEAFQEMLGTGHILAEKEDKDTVYTISEKGREAAGVFEKRLPFTVRESAQASALRVVRNIQRDAGILTTSEKRDEHDFIVHLDMQDVFSLHMNVVSQGQVSMLERNFRKNAEKIYQTILNALTIDSNDETFP